MTSVDIRKQNLLVDALLVLSTFMAYRGILQNGFISFDDIKYLIENSHVRAGLSLEGIRWAFLSTYDANWFPLTLISHMVDVSLFGIDPFGHHLVNLLLHTVNALLLYRLLASMSGAVWRSACVAALFALHPMHVESVAWAAERKDVLSTLFFMLTVAAYIGFVARRTIPRFVAVMLAFACGLAAKPMLVSLPLVLLLLDIWPLRRLVITRTGQDDGRRQSMLLIIEKLPLVLLSAASCVTTVIVQRQGGALNVESPLPRNVAHAMVNYAHYLLKAVWPADLAVMYPYEPVLPAWQVAGAVVALSLLTIFVIRCCDSMPYLLTGWFWYLITMMPVIGFLKFGNQSIADRYTYIPLIGVFLAITWALAEFLERKRGGKTVGALLAASLCFALGVATWRQTGYWRDSITLYEHALRVTGNNGVIQNNLAAELIKNGQFNIALRHVNEAIRIKPDYAKAYQNKGIILQALGDTPGAILAYETAIRFDPRPANVYYQLSLVYFRAGKPNAAQEMWQALRQVNPNLAESLVKQLNYCSGDYGQPRGK